MSMTRRRCRCEGRELPSTGLDIPHTEFSIPPSLSPHIVEQRFQSQAERSKTPQNSPVPHGQLHWAGEFGAELGDRLLCR